MDVENCLLEISRSLDYLTQSLDPISIIGKDEDDNYPAGPIYTQIATALAKDSPEATLGAVTKRFAETLASHQATVTQFPHAWSMIVQALSNIVSRAPAGELSSVLNQFVDAVRSKALSAQIRLRALATLANTFSNAANDSTHATLRATVLLRLIEEANSEKVGFVLKGQLNTIAQATRNPHVDMAVRRKALDALFRTVENIPGREMEAHSYNLELLMTLEKDKEISGEFVDRAAHAVVFALKIQSLYRYDDLLDLRAVLAADAVPAHKATMALLRVHTTGDLASLAAFNKDHPGALKSLGLAESDVQKKVQLLTLASMASGASELKFDDIAAKLAIKSEDVEATVISGIGKGIIEGRMDQQGRRMLVKRALVRSFDQAQWSRLRDNLIAWQKDIKEMTAIVDRARDDAQI